MGSFDGRLIVFDSQFWSFDSQNIKSYRVFKIGVPTSHCTAHFNISQNFLLESFDGCLIVFDSQFWSFDSQNYRQY